MANLKYTDAAVGTVFNEDGGSAIDLRAEGDTDANLLFVDASADAIGIGTNAPTSFLHLKDSTTAKSSLRLPSSVSPTSPNEGDLWNDSTDFAYIMFVDGVKQFVPGVLFKQTATVTVASSAAETTLVGAGRGTMSLPANFFVVGRTVSIKAGGFYGTAGAGPTNAVRIKLGSTTILQSSGDALTAGIGNDREWYMDALFTCRTTGAGGTFIGQGLISYWTGGSTNRPYAMQRLTTVSVSTTGALTLDITTQFGTSDAANIMNLTNLEVRTS